jgi:hypothetical protein
MAEEKASHMTTIGDLLTRDLSRKIEEIIQVDQADEQSVYVEITRRLGELMEADRKAGKLAKGPRGQLKGKTSSGGLRKNPPEGGRSLKKQGIDKNLADRDREAAALPEKKFEAEVERVVGTAVAAVTFKMYRRRLQRPSGFDRPSRAQPLGVGIGGLAPGVVDLPLLASPSTRGR